MAPVGLELATLADFPQAIDVLENGDTFAANAALKATQQARHLGRWVLADDSGLAVNALAGAPACFSARYSGPAATDASNNACSWSGWLRCLAEQRAARFVCHMTLADPSGVVRAESESYCCGRITWPLRGKHGFGYDPLFEIVEYHRTFGELGLAVKSCLSHRARAARRLIPSLLALVDSGVGLGVASK